MSRRHYRDRRSYRRRGPIKRVTRGLADAFGVARGVVIAGFVLGFVFVPLLSLAAFLVALYWVNSPDRACAGTWTPSSIPCGVRAIGSGVPPRDRSTEATMANRGANQVSLRARRSTPARLRDATRESNAAHAPSKRSSPPRNFASIASFGGWSASSRPIAVSADPFPLGEGMNPSDHPVGGCQPSAAMSAIVFSGSGRRV